MLNLDTFWDCRSCPFQVKMLGTKRFKDTIFITLPANGEWHFWYDTLEAMGDWERQAEFQASYNKLYLNRLSYAGQNVEIDVNGEAGEKAASESTINYTLWATVLGCVALILIVVVSIYYLDRPDRSQVSVVPATPSNAAPVTPERSYPAVVSELSPRTPQPFIDYVRRTIDETPYYKREPRRRVNPQNTF